MTLTVHHLGISQSERIVFLCEELGIPYNLVKHTRDPFLGPQSLKDVPGNSTGKVPFIQDSENDITLSESGAIAEYLLAKHTASNGSGAPKLSKSYGEKGYLDYIYWFHYANAGLQPEMLSTFLFDLSPLPEDDRSKQWAHNRLQATLKHIDDRLAKTKWLAGEDFSAADVMSIYSLTTQRYFGPLVSYDVYPNIVRYLADIGERPAYKRAMEKGDPEMKPLLGKHAPTTTLLEDGGIESPIWRK